MRICSLLPGATEAVFLLGAGDALVGVSHACDFPPLAQTKPVVLRSRLSAFAAGSSRAIDTAVRETLGAGGSLYALDADALIAAKPDIVITQDLCSVCAIDTPSVEAILARLHPAPRVLSWHAHTLQGVRDDVAQLGRAIGRAQEAQRFCDDWQRRIEKIQKRLRARKPVSVACLEWFDPLMSAGHWVPDMVALAGGHEVLVNPGERSVRINFELLRERDPDVLILMPCGLSIEQASAELPVLQAQPGWSTLAAARNGRVHLVDGSAYFNRPGPRLIDGIERLARLLHPLA